MKEKNNKYLIYQYTYPLVHGNLYVIRISNKQDLVYLVFCFFSLLSYVLNSCILLQVFLFKESPLKQGTHTKLHKKEMLVIVWHTALR